MKKILIVEDNEKHMKALINVLSTIDGIKIFKAYNMAEACYMLSLNEYSLFLVDIILDAQKAGDVSGINFVNMIRDNKKYQFTPVIFITSLEDPRLFAYSELHCYKYLEKPYDKAYVIRTVKEALEFPEVRSQKENAYFRKDGIAYSVKIMDITHITLGKPGVCIYTLRDCLRLGYYTAADIQRELCSDDFFRCNRNTVVNKNCIEFVDFANGYIKLKGVDKELELGGAGKKYLREEFRKNE